MLCGDDFSRMGRAIEGRYDRCRSWWRSHLDNTASYINAHVPRAGSVAVLGAGRLLDIDISLLLSRCERVYLFDADTSAAARWKAVCGRQYGKRVVGCITDLTESMEGWTQGLKDARQQKELIAYLQSCEAPLPTWSHGSFDGYISLNILGQIPLYWRDRVLAAVRGISPEEWIALESSMGRLQAAHIQGLAVRPGIWSILVTDTEYYFYREHESAWRVESALYGVGKDTYSATFSPKNGDTWLWHIAPQFIESDDEGEIHRVEARLRL